MRNGLLKGIFICAASASLFAAGCGDETGVTRPGEVIHCGGDAECPEGSHCDDLGGFCVPGDRASNQNQGPGQNQNGGENQNQGPGQNQTPGQNQNQGPGQDQNDGQNQDPGQNQNDGQNQGPGQNQNDGQNQDPFPGGDGSCPVNGDGEVVGDDRCVGMDFDDQCIINRPGESFEPDEKWHFKVDGTMPYSTYDGPNFRGNAINQVMMTPVVIDLQDGNGDIPNVIFTTFATTENPSDHDHLIGGILRSVNGDDGSHHWSVGYKELSAFQGISEARWRPQLGFAPGGSVAAGDITGDGKPEIVAAISDYEAGKVGLAAIRNDGSVLWISDEIPVDSAPAHWWWGGPSIADLDGDGVPEIVFGASVYDNQGRLMWDATDAPGLSDRDSSGSNNKIGPLSVVADLTRQRDPVTNRFTQEVITGNAAFTHRGDLLWEVADPALKEGYPAVADFDGDRLPEVVVVTDGSVRIHNGQTGALVWGPVKIPNAGRLGPPTIADMTGDGRLEIGVAGKNGYFVLRVDYGKPGANNNPTYNQALVWEQTTQDVSSSTTGSSVFDFNGDGKASVVYNDELYLRVFDGATGEIQFEAPNPSYTAVEYPVIADVNNDGRANIIVPSSDYECGDQIPNCVKGSAGVRVFGDANDNWVSTRRVWNQHAYCINNINEDGTIPAQPVPSYLDHNTFRLNTLTELDPQAAPDLAPNVVGGFLVDGCNGWGDVWVVNRGAARVGAGIPVTIYAERGGTKQRIKVYHTETALEPGEAERIGVEFNAPSGSGWKITVVVDDDGTGTGTRKECNEGNNTIIVVDDLTC